MLRQSTIAKNSLPLLPEGTTLSKSEYFPLQSLLLLMLSYLIFAMNVFDVVKGTLLHCLFDVVECGRDRVSSSLCSVGWWSRLTHGKWMGKAAGYRWLERQLDDSMKFSQVDVEEGLSVQNASLISSNRRPSYMHRQLFRAGLI